MLVLNVVMHGFGLRVSRQVDKTVRKVSVLICEDSAVQQTVLHQTLQRIGFTDADIKSNASAALDAVLGDEKKYRILLLDVHTDAIDGLTVCRLVRQGLPVEKQPKIVLMSADPTLDIEKVYADGADAFLRKPISKEALESILSEDKERMFLFADNNQESQEGGSARSKAMPAAKEDNVIGKFRLEACVQCSRVGILTKNGVLSWLGKGVKHQLENASRHVVSVDIDHDLFSGRLSWAFLPNIVALDGLSWDVNQEPVKFWQRLMGALRDNVPWHCTLLAFLPSESSSHMALSRTLNDVGFHQVVFVPEMSHTSEESERNGIAAFGNIIESGVYFSLVRS